MWLWVIGALLVLYLWYKPTISVEGFGRDEQPFEPDNTLLNRNVWDDIDYRTPYMTLMKFEK